jgi:4-hydroxy-2-oxoheptanedioate aldolase
LDQRNGGKILIANMESVPALENLDEICSVPGLDAVLIGRHDLSCSLGIPEQYDHPRFDEAVRTVFRIEKAFNKVPGDATAESRHNPSTSRPNYRPP